MVGKEQLASQLAYHILGQNYIDIVFIDERLDNIHCMPIKISEKMLYALNFFDFLPDGFIVVRLEDIKEVRYNDACEYFEDIVKQEGALEQIQNALPILLDDWRNVFTSLKDAGLIAIVDIGKENCVNVGKIVDASNQDVVMRCFSPAGIWDNEEWEEPYTNITSIRFLSHYTQIYSKYLKDGDS
jgi:hypothetical protein